MTKQFEKYLWIAIIIAFLFIVIKYKPAITGFVVYPEDTLSKTWLFDNPSEYSYSNITLSTKAGLTPITITYYWNTTESADYILTAAWFNPQDKTSKLNELDSQKHEKHSDKLLELFFSEILQSDDIISFYITDGDPGTLYLCDVGVICDSPGHGFVSYDGNEGWYNLTINGLDSDKLNFVSPKIKIDYVVSSRGSLVRALYGHLDKLSELYSDDGSTITVDQLLDIKFQQAVSNGDVIAVYADNSEESSTIYLCDYGSSCSSGYGSVFYDGGEGWYNLTVNNLQVPQNSFSIVMEETEIDKINAIHNTVTEHSSTNITYPSSGEVMTLDFSPANIYEWLTFSSNSVLNGQAIAYFYSIDSGIIWNPVPTDGELNLVNRTKIMFKALLSSDLSSTPVLNSMTLTYKTETCMENWVLQNTSCQSDDRRLTFYLDENSCGTTVNLSVNNGTYASCDYCTPSWIEINSSCRPSDKIIGNFNDANSCFTATNLASDNTPPERNIYSCDYCSIYNCTDSAEMELNQGQKLSGKWSVNLTKVSLEIESEDEDAIVSIINFDKNPENITTSEQVNLFTDVEANLTNASIKIVMYYTDEEIIGIDEQSLKVHYFNEETKQWEALESFVNATENYVYAFTSHNSLYGLFGDKLSSASGGSSSGGGGGGGGGSGSGNSGSGSIAVIENSPTSSTKNKEVAAANLIPQEIIEKCSYDFTINDISLVNFANAESAIRNNGNCNIKSAEVKLSPEFAAYASISSYHLENPNIVLNISKRSKGLLEVITGAAIQYIKPRHITGFVTVNAIGINDEEVIKQVPFAIEVADASDVIDPVIKFGGTGTLILIVVIVGLLVMMKRRRPDFHKRKMR